MEEVPVMLYGINPNVKEKILKVVRRMGLCGTLNAQLISTMLPVVFALPIALLV
jgi:hypothetical protein